MPNTEVKLLSADGSWGFPPVRVGRCQANENNQSLVVFLLCPSGQITKVNGVKCRNPRVVRTKEVEEAKD